MSITLDIIDGARVTETAQGLEVTRVAHIKGISGDRVLRARAAIEAPGMPRYGDVHPAWGDLRVVDIQLSAIDAQQWTAQIIYRVPSAGELAHMGAAGVVIERSWFAVTVTEERNTDINGERLYHWYKGRPLTPVLIGSTLTWQRTTTQFLWKNELAEVQRPSVGARIVMSELSDIRERLPFSGAINSARWSGYGPGEWLLGGMESREERGRWVNTHELFYNPDTWRFESVVEYFGAPPDDATAGNGIARFDVYPSMNFNLLPFRL